MKVGDLLRLRRYLVGVRRKALLETLGETLLVLEVKRYGVLVLAGDKKRVLDGSYLREEYEVIS